MLDLNSSEINTSTEVKTCVYCGEVNYQDRGQCKNCGRTTFLSEKEFEKQRRNGAVAMITGPITFFISLGLLLFRYNSSIKSPAPKWAMLPFVFLGLFVTVDGAFRYTKGRGNLTLNLVLSSCVVAIVAIGLYFDLF